MKIKKLCSLKKDDIEIANSVSTIDKTDVEIFEHIGARIDRFRQGSALQEKV